MSTKEAVKHTPGPWRILPMHGEYGYTIVRDEPEDAYSLVAEAYGQTPENAEANARLIAAAPEMLEALKDIARIARKPSVPKRTIATRAEALIAQVEGR